MRIVSKTVLREFWIKHPDAEEPLKTWYEDAERAQWQEPNDVRQVYATASILPNNRVVFNIRVNHYRLVVQIHYNTQIVYIRFVGTHSQYDQIDATVI